MSDAAYRQVDAEWLRSQRDLAWSWALSAWCGWLSCRTPEMEHLVRELIDYGLALEALAGEQATRPVPVVRAVDAERVSGVRRVGVVERVTRRVSGLWRGRVAG